MRHRSLPVLLVALLISFTVATGDDQPLPEDAERLIKEFEEQVDAIELKAEAEIRVKQQKLIERLQVLRDNLIKDGNLDDSLEIHHVIKQMKAVYVQAEWNSHWFPAELIEQQGDEYWIQFPNEPRVKVSKEQIRHPHHRRPTLKDEPRLAREAILIRPRNKPKEGDEGQK